MPHSQDIGLEQLTKYFHLPINAVAKELGVCATVLKKICRKNGIPRWPHRKIKSLDKMIGSLQAISPKSPEDEERIKQEIAALVNKKRYLITNPNSLVKIKKTHTTSTSTKGTKRKNAKQELPSDAASEESELSPAFLDADILDWDGVSTWQAPPFTDADLASVPYDSPLGRALLMRPYPLDQLPRILSAVQPPHTSSSSSSSRPHPHHMAMPGGGPVSFSPFSPHTMGPRMSAFSAKLPDIGVAESAPVTLASGGEDGAAGMSLAGKLDVLEPNVLHPSVNPLPFTTQYGIHPITQTLHQHVAGGSEWRDTLPPWYSDEYSSRAILGLPADFGTTAMATAAAAAVVPTSVVPAVDHLAVGDLPSSEHHPDDPDEASGAASQADDATTAQSFLVAGSEGSGTDIADTSIFDHLL
ncbi:RWPRK domain containing protein [Acanthamoeba castellanii str. Neff]|uniref:RWPRK domain containing protein n=1 Tax=Acanthamoeba castellanii (strain ATCC 30010 / Neff) TaxID=1257118 RepID=L8H164_ACACF|nr:RWPRK domain containing protein [Acanthamoeba castellanii str. Neff]ELR19000.1 RWPRK domain containing protein [Acanthamoeba castellanii str. Neff]